MTSAFGNYYTHRQALVKILLMLLRNYCAKIATKKRKHNTNSTGMSVNLVVCVLAVLSLSGAEKGRGQLCWLVQKRTASSSQPSQARPLPQFVKKLHHQAAQQPSAASKIQKYPPKACKQRRFHAQFASFFRFMAANLSLTHCVTRARPLMWV